MTAASDPVRLAKMSKQTLVAPVVPVAALPPSLARADRTS